MTSKKCAKLANECSVEMQLHTYYILLYTVSVSNNPINYSISGQQKENMTSYILFVQSNLVLHYCRTPEELLVGL